MNFSFVTTIFQKNFNDNKKHSCRLYMDRRYRPRDRATYMHIIHDVKFRRVCLRESLTRKESWPSTAVH